MTEEGRSFLVDARRVLALATQSVQAMQRLSRGETGQLNIAYSSNFNFELLPETLVAFRLAFPHVSLNLFNFAFLCDNLCVLCVKVGARGFGRYRLNAEAAEVHAKVAEV